LTISSILLCFTLLAPQAARAQEVDSKEKEKATKKQPRPLRPTTTPRTNVPQPATTPAVTPKNAPATPTTAKPADTRPADGKADKDAKPADTARPAEGKPGVEATTGKPGEPPLPGEDDELYKCKKLPPNKKVKVTLKPEAEFKDLLAWAMSFTCKNFIYGTGISGRSGKVTIMAPVEMSPADAWRLFLVALQTMNLTVVPKGKTLEIVETSRAKESPIEVYKPGAAPNSDQIVRVILRPEYMTVEEAAGTLQALKSKDGTITSVPQSGVLVITDYGSQIDKMVDVMRTLDEPAGAEKIYIVRVNYADAVELSQKLSEIFGIGQGGSRGGGAAPAPARPAPRQRTERGKSAPTAPTAAPAMPAGGGGNDAGSSTPSKIIPDERTNSLIIISSERGYARILALIKRLDVAIEGGEGRIHVYPLNNADAEELSNTLNGIATGSGASRGGAGGRGQPAAAAPAGGAASTAVFEGNVRITHDKPTNSLIIVSSVKDYLSLKDVVKKLDIPRKQVFVEATILEVSLDKTRQLGTAWHAGAPVDVQGEQSLLFGGVQHAALSSVVINPAALTGLAAGLLGPELENSSEFLGISIPSFGLMFQLLQSNNDVNILSSPHILTTDNEPAEISVGQNIPYSAGGGIPGLPTGGGQTGTGTTPLPFFGGPAIQRHDVVLKLKLTPHINDADQVRFELEQEISDILSENFGNNLGPVWSTRTVKTMIVVRDQQPVVIGGLMSDKIVQRESKVPILGDIPILGYLFKHASKQKIKTNLLILLTPYIIHDQSDLQTIFEKKVRERREFIQTFTSFQPGELEADIDYSKKHGFLQMIHKSVRLADEDDRLAAEAEESMRLRSDEGPVEFPEDFRDGDEGGGDEPAPPPPSEPKIE
jgi:general secretion pathway protein D